MADPTGDGTCLHLAQAGVRLVATDLDGTFLLPDGSVSRRAAAAVRAARSRGVDVIPVTARSPWSVGRIASETGMGPLAVCGNGAVVWDLDAGAVVDHVTLDADVAARLVSALRSAIPGILFASETVDVLVAEAGLFEPDVALVWNRETTTAPDVLEHLRAPVTKLICRHPEHPEGDALLERVTSVCGVAASVTSAGTGWAEIGAPGITKAVALQRICDRLGIAVADVVCVGDSLNDLPMLAWAGHAVAVANARPEVLAAAGRVVPANRDDGVAQLLEELGGDVSQPSPATPPPAPPPPGP